MKLKAGGLASGLAKACNSQSDEACNHADYLERKGERVDISYTLHIINGPVIVDFREMYSTDDSLERQILLTQIICSCIVLEP